MHYTQQDIQNLDRVTRLKLINSITGIKPANLIGTISNDRITNLAVFSSVVHLGSDPALIGFINRPQTAEVGHTLDNIRENGVYTINHILPEFVEQAHYTSAKFDSDISEFQRCDLTEEYIDGFTAPFVKESQVKIGLQFKEAIPIEVNGTTLVIGEIVHLILPDTAQGNGNLNLEELEGVGISGLNNYYKFQKIAQFPYARIHEVPDFNN